MRYKREFIIHVLYALHQSQACTRGGSVGSKNPTFVKNFFIEKVHSLAMSLACTVSNRVPKLLQAERTYPDESLVTSLTQTTYTKLVKMSIRIENSTIINVQTEV